MDPALVTGGTGFIGRKLVSALHERGIPLVLLQRSEAQSDQAAEVIHIPEFRPEILSTALRGRHFSAVYHLASYGVSPADRDASLAMQVNLFATLAIVEAAAQAGAKSMVITGSSAEYSAPTTAAAISENHGLEARRIYGTSKAAAGLAAIALANARSLPLANARLFNVFGPGEQPHRLIPSLIAGFKTKARVPLSLGTQVRDFVYVDDAVEAIIALSDMLQCEGVAKAGAYNVATAIPTSVRDFAEAVGRIAGVDHKMLGFGDISMRPDEISWLVGNSDLLQQRTGWRPSKTVIAGVTETLRQDARQ